MALMKRIKQAMSEFPEQAAIVRDTYGGCKFWWILDMAWCIVRYGARPIDYVRFEFHKKSGKERDRYMTIYRYFGFAKILRKSIGDSDIMGCKSNEYKAYAKFIKRDWMVVDSNTSRDEILSFIHKYHTVIAKPNNGEQGKGVMKINENDNGAIDELITYKTSVTFVMEECLVNSPEISAINSTSLNTIRATTFIDGNGNLKIISIILRVGAPGSHVDNWGSGGVGYNFDVTEGICNCPGLDKLNRPYLRHPGSNVKMLGFELPDFDKLISYINELVKVEPKAKFVGWDIAITPNGYDLVEMNCPAGHDMFQSFNNPVYRFFKDNW